MGGKGQHISIALLASNHLWGLDTSAYFSYW